MSLSPQRITSRLGAFLGLVLLGIGIAACQSEDVSSSYIARVGSHHLTQKDLDRMLADMGPIPDSTKARQQIIDQWVTRTLLYREAQRRNLESIDEIQRELNRQRRSILVTALKNRLYDEADLAPSPQEVRAYFGQHKEQMRLRQPYLSVRYLATDRPAAAQTVRQALRTLPPEDDSTWIRLVREHATDTLRARRLSQRFLPVDRLTKQLPFSAKQVAALREGDTAPIVQNNGWHHVLQLDRRIPEDTIPQLEWFEPEIRRRLRIRARKQMYAHEVQRLRNEAQANDALETP